MSRCFPYPPPGYEKNGIRDDALIHSIKIQREGEKAKKERKKEKKREKKEKKLSQENGEVGSKKHSHKRRHGDERYKDDQKKADCQKRGNEAEHVEKSSLTEEPVRSQNSSDSTFNSNKRQKQISSPEARHYSGSIIRIRLPIQRHKDPEVQPSKEQPCPASRRTIDASIKQMHEPVPVLGREQVEHQCSTSKSTGHLSGLGKDRPDLLSGASEVIAHETKPALPVSLCSNCSPTSALNFRKLVEDWVPPQVPIIYTNLDSQDWLFDAKQKKNKNCEAKRNNACSDDLQHGNSTMWPQSFYLPEADIYALPFTVPF